MKYDSIYFLQENKVFLLAVFSDLQVKQVNILHYTKPFLMWANRVLSKSSSSNTYYNNSAKQFPLEFILSLFRFIMVNLDDSAHRKWNDKTDKTIPGKTFPNLECLF